jgi:hypothetical protein
VNAGLTSAAGNLALAKYGSKALTFPHILTHMTYDKRKAFYTLFLGLTWSDTPFRMEDNLFVEE